MNKTNNIQTIFIGVDVHTTNYNICFYNPETNKYEYETRLKPVKGLLLQYIKKMIQRHFKDGDYEFIIGYEAGYTGYELSRFLNESGFTCIILAPNTIKRSAKQKKIKNDVQDARLIAKTLSNHDYSAVFVPTPEDEAVKHILTFRETIQKQLTQIKNSIKAFVVQKDYKKGKKVPGCWTKSYKTFLRECLKNEESIDDQFTLGYLLEEFEHLTAVLEDLDKKLEEIALRDRYVNQAQMLCALKGIGLVTALNLIMTIGDIKRFPSAKSFANYVGLTPGEYSSGNKENQLAITKNGNARLRKLLVLAAQTYSRGTPYSSPQQPVAWPNKLSLDKIDYARKATKRLHKKFRHLRNDLNKAHNKVVCAVARELANFAWGMLSGDISA